MRRVGVPRAQNSSPIWTTIAPTRHQTNYAGVWDRHILPRLGHHTLRDLCVDPHLIARFHADMEQAGVGASTRRYTLTVPDDAFQRFRDVIAEFSQRRRGAGGDPSRWRSG